VSHWYPANIDLFAYICFFCYIVTISFWLLSIDFLLRVVLKFDKDLFIPVYSQLLI
jgi:hypothetical protein